MKDADDFWNLSGIETLLASYPQAATKDLQALRAHRNYVTHGGRVGKLSNDPAMQE